MNSETYKRCRGYLKRMGTEDLISFARYIVFSSALSSQSETIGDLAVRDAKQILSNREISSKEFEWLARARNATQALKSGVSNDKIVEAYVKRLRSGENSEGLVDDMMFDPHVSVSVVIRFVTAMYDEEEEEGETRVAKQCRTVVASLTSRLAKEITENETNRLDAILRFASESDVVKSTVSDFLQVFVDKEEKKETSFKVQEIVLRLLKEHDMLKADQTNRLVSVCVEQKIRQVFEKSNLARRVGNATSTQDRDTCTESMMSLAETKQHFEAIAYVLRAWCSNTVDEEESVVFENKLELAVTWLLRDTEEEEEEEEKVQESPELKWWTKLLVRAAEDSCFDFIIEEQSKGLPVNLSVETELNLTKMLQDDRSRQIFCLLSSHIEVRETVFQGLNLKNDDDELRRLILTRTRASSWTQDVLSWLVQGTPKNFVVPWIVSSLCISGRVVQAGDIILNSSQVHHMFRRHPRASLIMLKPFLSSSRQQDDGIPIRLIDAALKKLEKFDSYLKR